MPPGGSPKAMAAGFPSPLASELSLQRVIEALEPPVSGGGEGGVGPSQTVNTLAPFVIGRCKSGWPVPIRGLVY